MEAESDKHSTTEAEVLNKMTNHRLRFSLVDVMPLSDTNHQAFARRAVVRSKSRALATANINEEVLVDISETWWVLGIYDVLDHPDCEIIP